jgi:hypothetical protein
MDGTYCCCAVAWSAACTTFSRAPGRVKTRLWAMSACESAFRNTTFTGAPGAASKRTVPKRSPGTALISTCTVSAGGAAGAAGAASTVSRERRGSIMK